MPCFKKLVRNQKEYAVICETVFIDLFPCTKPVCRNRECETSMLQGQSGQKDQEYSVPIYRTDWLELVMESLLYMSTILQYSSHEKNFFLKNTLSPVKNIERD